MFLFGILSSPIPYLLIAAFYFFGFAIGMFSGSADSEASEQIHVKNIQVEPQLKTVEPNEYTFQFQDFISKNKILAISSPIIYPHGISQKEKLIYLVRNIRVNSTTVCENNFSRPPPLHS